LRRACQRRGGPSRSRRSSGMSGSAGRDLAAAGSAPPHSPGSARGQSASGSWWGASRPAGQSQEERALAPPCQGSGPGPTVLTTPPGPLFILCPQRYALLAKYSRYYWPGSDTIPGQDRQYATLGHMPDLGQATARYRAAQTALNRQKAEV